MKSALVRPGAGAQVGHREEEAARARQGDQPAADCDERGREHPDSCSWFHCMGVC